MKVAHKTVIMAALTAGIICLLVYLRTLTYGFVNYDDQDFVLNNEAIRQLDWGLLAWAFTYLDRINSMWVPLTHISFALDYHFWQLNPMGYHLTNILLHGANTVLVVLIADRLCRKEPAANGSETKHRLVYLGMLLLAGILFGIHPLRVESVVWVSERKDVLNGLFSLSSVYCYLLYVASKEYGNKKGIVRNYCLSLVMLLVASLAKPNSVVIPALLVVIDWYPLGRFRKGNICAVLMEKVPFVLVAGTLALVVIITSGKTSYLLSMTDFPMSMRFIVSGNALFEYFRQLLYPVGISPLVVIPAQLPRLYIFKGLVFLFISCVAVYAGYRRKGILATWFGFVLPLVPVLAFFQGTPLAHAAHNTYLASVAPCIAAAVAMSSIYAHAVARGGKLLQRLICSVTIVVLAFYTVITLQLMSVWKDSGTMWTRVIKIQPFDRAFFSRGLFYADNGRYLDAVADYTACLNIMTREQNPERFNLYAFRGEALASAGRFEEAVQDFTTALGMYSHQLYYYQRGMAFRKLGKEKEAEEDFGRAGRASGQMCWFNR